MTATERGPDPLSTMVMGIAPEAVPLLFDAFTNAK